MKHLTLILLCALLLNHETAWSQNNKALKFLKTVNSFDFAETDSTLSYGRMDLTSYSLKNDSTEYVSKERQKDFFSSNPFLLKLLNLKQGTILPDEADPGYYYKSVAVDSVLSIRYASLSFSIEDQHIVQLLYKLITDSMKAGKTWEQSLPLENETGAAPGKKDDKSSGWLRASQMDDAFVTDFMRHKAGEVYLYESPEHQMAWIINKTDKETYFRRNKIVMVGTKPKQ